VKYIFSALLLGIAIPSLGATPDSRETIAVLDFTPSNASASDAVTITGFVRRAMVQIKKYRVVEKKNMDKILAVQAFQQTGCTDSECAVKLGKVLNARKVVVGEYAVMEGMKILTAQLVDVETSEIEQTGVVQGFDLKGATDAASQLVAQLTGAAVAAPQAPAIRTEPTPAGVSAIGSERGQTYEKPVGRTYDPGGPMGVYIEAMGIGAADPARPTSTQRKTTSRDAAVVDAQYQLVAKLKAVQIEGGITIEQAMDTNPRISAMVNNLVRDAEITTMEWTNDDGCVVTARISKSAIEKGLGLKLQ